VRNALASSLPPYTLILFHLTLVFSATNP
jgi:hypothetical protein